MQIDVTGKRNITLDFNAPRKFRLTQNGAEIPYIRTGKNSFRLSKDIDGSVELEEINEPIRLMQPVALQPQQMAVINTQDVDRLNEAVKQMALVNPADVLMINNAAEQLERTQNFIAEEQNKLEQSQIYLDSQQQKLNESAVNIQALETNNAERLDNAEVSIYNIAEDLDTVKTATLDNINSIDSLKAENLITQATLETKADKVDVDKIKEELEEYKGDNESFKNALSNYSGGLAVEYSVSEGGKDGQILTKITDETGVYGWKDPTPVIVKSKVIPTATEKLKGEVYQYVGETGDYIHGYIYECQKIGNTYQWIRLDVQPNDSEWGKIRGNISDQTDLQTALNGKQDKLSTTQMEAANSGANTSNIGQITTNQNNITSINDKIPTQASSSNQLADKDFVNSSIATNTANFIGTFSSISDLESYSGTVTNNDYAFVVNRVVTDNGNDWATFTALNAYDKSLLSNFDYAWVIKGANFDLYRFDIVNQVWELRATAIEKSSVTLNSAYNRYKAVVSGGTTWTYEYTLNNSSFTASQWSAINSGITDDLVSEFKAKGALLDYTGNTLTLEDSDGNALSSVTIQLSEANTDLSNLTSQGQNIANWSSNVTNCITEIPQDIKLELNNGTLTLKAGSKVYVPNGVGVFDVVTVPSDVVFHSGTIGTATFNLMLCCNLTGGYGVRANPNSFVSGATAPTNTSQVWYDTTNNAVKKYENGSWVRAYSLPIGIYVRTNGVATSINQVFNGFGYIGSTIFALPGVKGLVPNGRNADGSLKNTEYVVNSVIIDTLFNNQQNVLCIGGNVSQSSYFVEREEEPSTNYTLWYKPSENIMYRKSGAGVVSVNGGFVYAFTKTDNAGIAFFTPKTAFHALDYNDKGTIAGWGMPSNKYIDLTLGASGATYTAPANGYFCLDKAGTQNEYIDIRNNTTGLLRSKTTISAPRTESIAVYMPCKRGDEIAVVYTATGTTNRFRFIYAEGENV